MVILKKFYHLRSMFRRHTKKTDAFACLIAVSFTVNQFPSPQQFMCNVKNNYALDDNLHEPMCTVVYYLHISLRVYHWHRILTTFHIRHVKNTRTKIPKLLDSVQARMWAVYLVNYSKKKQNY